MAYESFTAERFFTDITTEAAARALLWRSRFQGKEFHCPHCHSEQFYTSNFIPLALGPKSVPAKAVRANFASGRAPSLKPRRPHSSSG